MSHQSLELRMDAYLRSAFRLGFAPAALVNLRTKLGTISAIETFLAQPVSDTGIDILLKHGESESWLEHIVLNFPDCFTRVTWDNAEDRIGRALAKA